MTKHIKIKVLTRLPNDLEYYLDNDNECKDLSELEVIDNKLYNVLWINKHDTSLDKTFNNPLDQLESLSIR